MLHVKNKMKKEKQVDEKKENFIAFTEWFSLMSDAVFKKFEKLYEANTTRLQVEFAGGKHC